MNLHRLLLTAVLTVSTTAFAAEKSFDRTLTVSATPNVTVDTGSGNIHLHPGSDAQIHIAARMKSGNNGWFGNSSSGDVESRMQQIANNPPIHQSGNDITIGERHHDDLFRNISIDYDITLPRASAITAGSGSGDVDVDGVGASLRASTGSGTVRAHGVRGATSLESGSGDIELEETASGQSDIRAHTGSGNIHLSGIDGGLRADTGSGNITIAGKPSADWKLETGSGNIHMDLGAQARFMLNATTGSGSIHTDQPITLQGSVDKHRINGSVNGGGPTLRAETGSGDIEIR